MWGGDGVPVALALVDGYGQHSCHDIVDLFETAVGLWVVRTGSNFVHARQIADGGGELGGELRAFVGDESGLASP